MKMNKWEKVFYQKEFKEMKKILNENMEKQQEDYQRLYDKLSSIEEKESEIKRLLTKIDNHMEGIPDITSSKVNAEIEQFNSYILKLHKMDKEERTENFDSIVSLLKLFLANTILDDMEEMGTLLIK